MTATTLETPAGPGRLFLDVPTSSPRAVLLLGHGAGGGVEAFDLAALAAALPDEGIVVVRFEQPWRTAGRRVAGPPASLDAASVRILTGRANKRAAKAHKKPISSVKGSSQVIRLERKELDATLNARMGLPAKI